MRADIALAESFVDAHPADASRILEELPTEQVSGALGNISARAAALVVGEMVPATAAAALAAIAPDRCAEILERLAPSDAATVLRPLVSDDRERVLRELDSDRADVLRATLGNEERTAGALMDPRAIAVPPETTISAALGRTCASGEEAPSLVCLVDHERRPVGVVALGALLRADPDAPIGTFAPPTLATISARAGTATIRLHPGWRRQNALPVVDDRGAFVGMLHATTARRVEDTTADDPEGPARAAATALGEVWGVGIAGFAQWVLSLASVSQPPESGGTK